MDAQIYFKMIEFDKKLKVIQSETLKENENLEIPVRDLMIRCSLCRSVMEIGHSNLNFGNMDKNERRTKKIVIRNCSEAPLLYRIRKSGSIASGDLFFSQGRVGVVRGYGKREVQFEFDPSLPGIFQEKLTIENIRNPANTLIVIVKAQVRQPANFSLNVSVLDFGPCLVNQLTFNTQEFTISNPNTKQSRMFEVRIDPQHLKFGTFCAEVSFSIPDDEINISNGDIKKRSNTLQKVMITKQTEEQIEHLSQKLKIAQRKGQKEKVDKIVEQLALLQSGTTADSCNLKSPETEIKEAILSSSSDALHVPTESPIENSERKLSDSDSTKSRPSSASHAQNHKVKRTDWGIIFGIPPLGIRSIKVHFRPTSTLPEFEHTMTSRLAGLLKRSLSSLDSHFCNYIPDACSIRVLVNEYKNVDVIIF